MKKSFFALLVLAVVIAKAEERVSLLDANLNSATMNGYVDLASIVSQWANSNPGAATFLVSEFSPRRQRPPGEGHNFVSMKPTDAFVGATTIPEPSSSALLIIAALIAIPQRNRKIS